MKGLIINAMVLALFLTGLSIIGEHPSWAGEFTFDGFSYLAEDPNEPEPEGRFIDGQIIYLSEDSNEPEPEGGFIDGQIVYLSEDPNEGEDYSPE